MLELDESAAPPEVCPSCQAVRAGYLRYCLTCGFDFEAGQRRPRSTREPGTSPATMAADQMDGPVGSRPLLRDLRYLIRLLRSWSGLLIALVLLAGAAAYLISAALPRLFEGNVTLVVGQGLQVRNPDYNQVLASQQLAQTYARLATTRSILGGVITKTGLTVTTEQLSKRITVEAPRELPLVNIAVQADDAQSAAVIANTLAAELIAASPAALRTEETRRFIEADLAATQAEITEMQVEIDELASDASRTPNQEQQLQVLQNRIADLRQTYAATLRLASGNGANLLTVVDPAVPPSEPVPLPVILNVRVAMLIGLAVALGVVFLYEWGDKRRLSAHRAVTYGDVADA